MKKSETTVEMVRVILKNPGISTIASTVVNQLRARVARMDPESPEVSHVVIGIKDMAAVCALASLGLQVVDEAAGSN